MNVLFTSNTCPSCHLVRDVLARNPGAPIVEQNVDVVPGAKQALFATGSMSVPTALFGQQVVIGAQAILLQLRLRYGVI